MVHTAGGRPLHAGGRRQVAGETDTYSRGETIAERWGDTVAHSSIRETLAYTTRETIT